MSTAVPAAGAPSGGAEAAATRDAAGAGGRGSRSAGAATAGQGVGADTASRGRTDIADRVLEKIAAHALTEVAGAGGVARRVLGVPVGRGAGGSAPRVDARTDGRLAMLRMTVSVGWPAPVRQVAQRVREHVIERVSRLTGLEVRQVDIDVEALVVPGTPTVGRAE
ncbi:MAG: Asp23/Gls24 family envelope stress response protein [Micromonosporaceae bacterium]|jgi:uncharacterized alkaline shock family protein YloU